MQTDENIVFSGKRKLISAENVPAENSQRRLMDRLIVMGNASQNQAENVVGSLRFLLRQHIQRLAEREQRYARGPDRRAAGKLSDGFDRLAQFLFRQQAAEVFPNTAG